MQRKERWEDLNKFGSKVEKITKMYSYVVAQAANPRTEAFDIFDFMT